LSNEFLNFINMGKRTFVFGDIHGCYLTFKSLFEQCDIAKSDAIYLLGDYIDRGPAIKETLDYIFNLIDDGYELYPLRGNHEQMFLNSINSQMDEYYWLTMNGGDKTLVSFEVSRSAEIPAKYRNWISSLPFYYELDNYVIVHAGLNFHLEDPFEDKYAMLWTRDMYYDKSKLDKKIIVGHTPTPLKLIEKSINQNIILLDGGCVYKNYHGLGKLCVLELSNMQLFTQDYIG